MIRIAKAVKADARKIAELEYSLAMESRRLERIRLASGLKKKLEAEMKKLIGDSRNCVLKAVDDSSCAGGEIVGILSGGVRKHSLRYADKKFVYAYVLYVSPAYRRKGIARKLFRALFSWARCKGLKEIGLKTQARNAPALKAYRAFGFRDSFIELKKFV